MDSNSEGKSYRIFLCYMYKKLEIWESKDLENWFEAIFMKCLPVINIDHMNLVMVWEKLFLNMWAYLSQYVTKIVHQFTIRITGVYI